jgi:ribosomal-protein-alanine N-acetyltransferase
VAATKKKVVGYVISDVVPQKNKTTRRGHLLNLAVDPEFRRMGVGTMMLEEITEHLRRENVEAIWLETRASNSAAIKFYMKMGYQEKGRKHQYYPNEDAVVMVKTLKDKGKM